jgi:hypothetical protein
MFFVTLNHPNGGVVPLMNTDEHGNESVATFRNKAAAKLALRENMLGAAYGGVVYDTDTDGEDV